MGGTAKTEKMSVTLPKELVAEIRSIASQGEISSLFTEALEFYLARLKMQEGLKAGFGAWKDEDHPELRTPEDTVCYVREMRKSSRDYLFKDDDAPE